MKIKFALSITLAFLLNTVASAEALTQSEAVNLALSEIRGQILSVELIAGDTSNVYKITILTSEQHVAVTKVISVTFTNIDTVINLIR